VRLAPETRLRLIASAEAELLAGALYFDSEDARADEPFAVRTPHGSLHDVGTQFIVRVEGARLEVGVRDGAVALARQSGRSEVAAGQKLVVDRASSTVLRDAIPTFGEDWAWAEALAPPFDIDGRTVAEFLTWVSAQTGRNIEFDTPSTENLARAAELRGSIDLPPLSKLAAVLATTDLTYSIDGPTISIGTR
jgi:hypothetical protein